MSKPSERVSLVAHIITYYWGRERCSCEKVEDRENIWHDISYSKNFERKKRNSSLEITKGNPLGNLYYWSRKKESLGRNRKGWLKREISWRFS